ESVNKSINKSLALARGKWPERPIRNEPLFGSNDQIEDAVGALVGMLRALFTSAVLLAIGGPALADDMDVCRDRQADHKARFEACEKIIAAGQTTGKDLAIAYTVRGLTLENKRVYDQAITAFNAALDADPGNAAIIDSR